MGIGAADPEGTHPGPQRAPVTLPLLQRLVEIKGAVLKIDFRVRGFKIDLRWD